jgi:hypothetical protein
MPRRVFLFSGHMIDTPDRTVARFPPDKEPLAKGAIARLLEELGAGCEDLAVCGGACGGDLLFAEAALARRVALEIYLPFAEPAFIAESVDFAGGDWLARFVAARSAGTLHVMPYERGPLREGADAYEQNNLWMLEAAGRFGMHKVEFVCLWDGQGGDGPGGTQHLLQQVLRDGGRTHWLDTRRIWMRNPANGC